MFVLKGVIVTENDLWARKNGGDFFCTGETTFGRTQIFIFMLQLTVILWSFCIFIVLDIFFTGSNDFWETPDF